MSISNAQTQVLTNPEVVQAVKMAISLPMREMPISRDNDNNNTKNRIIPLRTPENFKRENIANEKDGSLKDYKGPFGISTITQNFDGVGINSGAPPDPVEMLDPIIMSKWSIHRLRYGIRLAFLSQDQLITLLFGQL